MIEAVNDDVSYPRFVELQLAADLIPGTPRKDLRALGDRYPEIKEYVARFGTNTPRQRGAGMASEEPFIHSGGL